MNIMATDQRTRRHYNRVPTPNISKVIQQELDDHSASQTDLSKLVPGITVGAVSGWVNGYFGPPFFRAQELAFIFGRDVNELPDNGENYPIPEKGKEADLLALANHIIDVVDRGEVRSKSLALDAKRNAQAYLEKMFHDPKNTLMRDRLQEALASTETGASEPTPAPAPSLPVANTDEENQIRMFLHQAEKFRQNSGLEWRVDDTGRLRARRVQVTEF